jgi:hypothetical protein
MCGCRRAIIYGCHAVLRGGSRRRLSKGVYEKGGVLKADQGRRILRAVPAFELAIMRAIFHSQGPKADRLGSAGRGGC